jgi:hypothetical protein
MGPGRIALMMDLRILIMEGNRFLLRIQASRAGQAKLPSPIGADDRRRHKEIAQRVLRRLAMNHALVVKQSPEEETPSDSHSSNI